MAFTKADVGPRMVNGIEVEIDDAEKQTIADEWNASESSRPMREWEQSMGASDATMTRHLEDVIDKIGTEGLPPETVAAHAAKKALRATKPA